MSRATAASSSKRASKAADQLARLRHSTEAMLARGDSQRAIESLLGIIASLQEDNARITERLQAAIRYRFGRRSERLTAEELGQLVLALGGSAHDATQAHPHVPVPPAQEECLDNDE